MPTKYSLKYALLGFALAGMTFGFLSYLPELLAYTILAILLASASGVYLRYAFIRREATLVTVEMIFMILFGVLAVVGVAVSPMFLALGFLLHGFWDMAHHPRYIRTSGPAWYQPMCLAFDWGVAAVITLQVLGAKS
jgi:hypothetical protein